MTKWMKRGSIVICLLAILLFLIGVSQLTFGAYYISKLPVFKVGSPVWIGFMNIASSVILFWFHHKSLELRPLWRRFRDAAQSKKSVQTVEAGAVLCGRAQHYRLHWSLGLCLTIVFINIANIIICEVGEWQHWLTRGERDQVTTGNLSLLGNQAHRVTVAQMSLATIVGVLSTVLNVWLLYKQPSACNATEMDSDGCQISLNQTMTSVNTGTLRPPKSTATKSSGGFDNPNWVYSEEKDSVRSQHVQHQSRPTSRPTTSVSVISDGMRMDGAGVVRYATIRRAPSILNVLPADQHTGRRHLKSASFRMEGERNMLRPHQRTSSAAVCRSKTMRESSFSAVHYQPAVHRFTDGPHTFAQRFQSSADGALSFVHDVTTEEEEAAAAESSVISIDPPVPTRVSNGAQTSAILEETSDDEENPAELPVVRRQVRSSDRIILRVESFRTVQSCGIPVRAPTAPVQRPLMLRNANVKRVSSSTQTELSVLKPASASLVAAQQQRIMQKRPQTAYPTLKNGPGTATTETATNNHAQVSPVESSSGYSSPRGTESKSPTPEPKQHDDRLDRDASNQDPANVTVIQIDPNPLSTKKEAPQYILAPVTEATYAIPRKRAERNATPSGAATRNDVPPHRDADFQVSINAKSVQRSASFQHMSQSGRKDYYNNEWLRAGNLMETQPVMTIPRPMLKGSQQRYTSTMSRRHHGEGHSRSSSSGSSLNRSTSMYLAMSEIQRKLDLLQWLGPRTAAVHQEMAPVHREPYSSTEDYYSGSGYSRYSDTSRRTRSRAGSRQMTALPPAPPPPPAANPHQLDETIDSAKTLAYLSELEMLARHWRAQLLYKVELNAPGAQMEPMVENDSFQC